MTRKKTIDELAEEILRDFDAGDTPEARAKAALQQAADAGGGGLRQEYLKQAQAHIAAIDPRRNPRALQELQANVLALQGRGGDTRIAHLTNGEMVIPAHMVTPELFKALTAVARARGVDPRSLFVGSDRNAINPRTGLMEFDVGNESENGTDENPDISVDPTYPPPITLDHPIYFGSDDDSMPASAEPTQDETILPYPNSPAYVPLPNPYETPKLDDLLAHLNEAQQASTQFAQGGGPFTQMAALSDTASDASPDSGATPSATQTSQQGDAGNQQSPAAPPQDDIPTITVTARAPTNLQRTDRFFDLYYNRLADLAQRMNVPEEIVISHALKEGGWDVGTPDKPENNMFGLSDKDGHAYTYPTVQASIDAFKKSRWPGVLAGKQDLDSYIKALHADPKLNFNKDDSGYDPMLENIYNKLPSRLNSWKQRRGLE